MKSTKILLFSLFLLSPIFTYAQSQNLTGKWTGNDGGTYYVRQIGEEVWWFGENSPTTPGFSNVAYGHLSGNLLILRWADVPKGQAMNAGILELVVQSNSNIVASQETGGFGGTAWTR